MFSILFLQEFIYHGAGFIFLLIASVFLLVDDNDYRNSKDHFVVAAVIIKLYTCIQVLLFS